MLSRISPLLAFVVLAWGSVTLAATTDILTLSTLVTNNLGGTPYVNLPTQLDVSVKNNGPDAYTSSSDSGLLNITVDIDEPSKPGGPSLEAFHFVTNVNVNIAPGSTTTLHLGNIGYVPHAVGSRTATTNSNATAPNIDPIPSNNSASTQFFVQVGGGGGGGGGGVPAMRDVGLVGLAFVMVTLALWRLRRRGAHQKS